MRRFKLRNKMILAESTAGCSYINSRFVGNLHHIVKGNLHGIRVATGFGVARHS